MAKQFKLTVEKRDLKGNKDLRQLRKDMKLGKLLGIIQKFQKV